jgi:hypothetical protein
LYPVDLVGEGETLSHFAVGGNQLLATAYFDYRQFSTSSLDILTDCLIIYGRWHVSNAIFDQYFVL